MLNVTSKKFQVSRTGLTVTEGNPPSFKEWEDFGYGLLAVERGMQFVVGDWINEGKKLYPDTYAKAIEGTGFDIQTLYDYASVARSIPVSLRNENLSFYHHKKIAKLEPEKQARWLEICEKAQKSGDSVSVRRLQASVLSDRLLAPDEVRGKAEDSPIETHLTGINRLGQWFAKARETKWLEQQDDEAIERLLVDFRPVEELIASIRERLPAKEQMAVT